MDFRIIKSYEAKKNRVGTKVNRKGMMDFFFFFRNDDMLILSLFMARAHDLLHILTDCVIW